MINKDILRQIVVQQKQELTARGTVPRTVMKEIMNWMADDRIIILTGLRRSGKSTLLKQIMKLMENWCFVNFEDERFINFKSQDFELLNEVLVEIYGEPKIYFFDEIQNIERFEMFVRRLQDQNKKIIITGSNASLLSKELGTRLTGRYKAFEVYPFSFKEYLNFNNYLPKKNWQYLTKTKVEVAKLFEKYLPEGGLPEYLKNKDMQYVKTLYENILYRDIIARYSIKKQKIVKELVNFLLSNISSQFTYNALKSLLNLSNAITVKEYISYLNNSYLFFELQRFDYSVKKQLNSPKKIYTVDSSFAKMAGFNFSENIGKILENIVYVELKRSNKEIYYYSGKNECDFLVKEGSKITMAIQVCYELNKGNKEREINGLLEAMKEFKLNKGFILTKEQSDEIIIEDKTIHVIPLPKWLLDN